MSETASPNAERMGVAAADLEFSSWGWAFRSQATSAPTSTATARLPAPHQVPGARGRSTAELRERKRGLRSRTALGCGVCRVPGEDVAA